MNLPRTPEMLAVAERVAWFASPDEVLRQPYLFMAHLMTFGLLEDVIYVKRTLGAEPFQETLLQS